MNDYVKFGLVTAGLCLFLPYLAGVVIGILIFCTVSYIIFKLIGG